MRARARNRDLLGSPTAHRALDDLHARPVNYEPGTAEVTIENGWHVDQHCQPLPSEPPGPPIADGAWQVACRLVRTYEFADPAIIRAVYYPDRPLENRDMLLEGRFLGLRFLLGVRINGVVDRSGHLDGRPVRVWGWCYRTLQGHLEMGQMSYEVWKWLDTGAVEFRIERYVKTARITNPVVRLGWRLFGRGMQLLFVRRSMNRMRRLVEAELLSQSTHVQTEPVALAGDRVVVAPAAEDPRARRRMERQLTDDTDA